MKFILLIGDGMGDVPIPALDGKTPLEATPTPTLDSLTPRAEQFLVRTVPEGFPPGSDVANLSLLGYSPQEVYSGRAPLEAASMGVPLGPVQTAFRCNLVHIEKKNDGSLIMADYSAGHISTEEARELITTLQKECGNTLLSLHPGISYRHLLVYNEPLPASFSTVPPHDHSGKDVSSFFQAYQSVDALRQLYDKVPAILEKHPVNLKRMAAGKAPANFFWLWGEGKRPAMKTFKELYGLTGGMISAVDLLKGIGVLSGLEVIEVEGATGYLDTNYAGKAQAALAVLKEKDFVAVHVEAPDECGHQGLLAEKMRAITDFDTRIIAPIVTEMERRGEPYRLAIAMDHFTPLHLRTHVDWPVPVILYSSEGTTQPSRLLYSEKNAQAAAKASGLDFPSGSAFFQHFVSNKKKS